MTIREIFEFLDRLFPVDTACDFDNVGLLIGDGERNVTKALISLDCTGETVEYAKENGCKLIITHHPVIFNPIKSLTADSIPYRLVKNGISVISMHTNLDIAQECGVSASLCKVLELLDIKPYIAEDGFILQAGNIAPLSANSLAELIKKKLGGYVKFADGGKKIERVLVCSGSGGEFLADAINGGFDALITAEVKHHQFLTASDNGISLFDAGHFNTEDIVIEPLKELLKKNIKDCCFLTFHNSCIKFK